MGRLLRRMCAAPMPGENMWIIELNVAGHQFTREMPDLRRRPFRFNPRNLHWPVLRQSHAA
jgi:hypothetical protein